MSAFTPDYKKLAPTASVEEAATTKNLRWYIFDETIGGIELMMYINESSFDASLALLGSLANVTDVKEPYELKGEISSESAIHFWNVFMGSFDEGAKVTSDTEFFTFIGLMNEVNTVMKALLPYQSTASAKEFNQKWDLNLAKDFELIDKEANSNFFVEWLTRYETSASRQLSNAGFHETLHMLFTLQPDFLSELVGLHRSNEDSPIDLSKLCDSPLLNLLIKNDSPERIQNQLMLLSGLLEKRIVADRDK